MYDLRLFTVGEPLNHEAWEWFHTKVGERRCPVVDTWWQTGTLAEYSCLYVCYIHLFNIYMFSYPQ